MLDNKLINEAIKLAELWQNRANELKNNFDREFSTKIHKMLDHPKDKALLIELMDQSFRSKSPHRIIDQIFFLLQKYGMANFFSSKDRLLLWFFQNIGKYFPNSSVPLFIDQIREDTKNVVIKGEDEFFNKHIEKRRAEGTRVNVNLIGEVVLGEKEASMRMDKYLNALQSPYIDYISIKISTMYSQINILDFDGTVDELVKRLSKIYAQAIKYPYIKPDGTSTNKFINLDMEEYRDFAITVEMFKKTLEKEEFKNFYGGIAIQAYLPDSFIYLKELTVWAKKRVKNGGSPIKVRLVKGANMEMEETESSHRGWKMVTYTDKSDTDSNYKRMVRYLLDPQNAPYVHLGTASHNLFELAFATVLAKKNGVEKYHTIEMLEGMSEASRLAIKEISKEVTLYAPIASKEQFTNAIAYLVRRLDENTSPQNFIRYSFNLEVGSKDWLNQKDLFLKSFEHEKTSFVGSKRDQDRLSENWKDYQDSSFDTCIFKNESDTDFILPQNQKWAKEIVKKWKFDKDTEHTVVPIVIANKEISKNRDVYKVIDKSQFDKKILAGKFAIANSEDIKQVIDTAKKDIDGWRDKTHKQRAEILKQVAIRVREKRADLIGISAAETGKVFTETDIEVSEAIDFLEFYPYSIEYFDKNTNLELRGKGVGVVIPPWNFPIAIPLGGIAAALASGNTVIIKPASAATLSAYEMCKCFWEAGVSKNTLQFLPCSGEFAGQELIPNKDIDFIIFTGSEQSVYEMFKKRSDLFITAETGGKDATIVTNLADRDQTVKNVVQSAFGNSGQKCSATSLLVLEDEVYNDEEFKKALIDTASSLKVGSVWDLSNKIGTLANPISKKLEYSIDTLEEDEAWALEPKIDKQNPYILKPAIKWGVKKGSFCHINELFGPVLSVMKAENLKDAIDIVNSTGYGLTSGLESLDEREINYWKEHVKAGNLYINRGTTGAIVLRQPFGGMGKSAIGAGRKVGIFNYITQFIDFIEVFMPNINKKYENDLTRFISKCKEIYPQDNDFHKLEIALQSYLYNYENEFSKEKDYVKIRGEDNHFKYIPLKHVVIRVLDKDGLFEVLSRILAALVSKVDFTISIDKNIKIKEFLEKNYKSLFRGNSHIVIEDDIRFSKNLNKYERIIYSKTTQIPHIVYEESSKNGVFIVRQKPLLEGRLELLNYFIEQSISYSYHRYGNIGIRAKK